MITLPSEIATSAGMFVFAIVQALIFVPNHGIKRAIGIVIFSSQKGSVFCCAFNYRLDAFIT